MIAPGQLLAGRYKLGEELGRGGMALVFLALDTVLDRQVAIKVLDPRYAEDEEFLARFNAEVASAAQLAHPNIVTVFDTGKVEGLPFLVMEYLPGGTLRQLLQARAPLEERQAIAIALALARALAFAHSRGVIHRDLKPSNVLFTADGIPKVADFGIAKALTASEYTQTGQLVGSVAYSAPEVLQGGVATPASDLYSLGIVLYEMLCGRTPFTGETPMALAVGHLRQLPPAPTTLNPAISPEVEALVLRCLEKTPALRFASADELITHLEQLQIRGPSLADDQRKAAGPGPLEATRRRPTPPQEPAPPASWHSPVLAALLVLLALAALAAGMLYGPALLKALHPEHTTVEVPDLVGKSISVAQQLAHQVNLQVSVQSEEENDQYAPNVIIRQLPAAGSTSTPGSEIFVVVSKGVGVVEVPDITGLPPEKAAKLLRTYHLRLGRQIDSEYSDKLPKNYILRQSPAAGEKVAKGSALDYWLSEGPKPVEPPPPALNGLPPAVVPVPLEPGDNSGTATPDRIVVPSTGPDTTPPAPATPEPDGNSSPSENSAPAAPEKAADTMPASTETAP